MEHNGVCRFDLYTQFAHDFTIDLDHTGLDELIGFPAGTNAGIGQVLVQTDGYIGVQIRLVAGRTAIGGTVIERSFFFDAGTTGTTIGSVWFGQGRTTKRGASFTERATGAIISAFPATAEAVAVIAKPVAPVSEALVFTAETVATFTTEAVAFTTEAVATFTAETIAITAKTVTFSLKGAAGAIKTAFTHGSTGTVKGTFTLRTEWTIEATFAGRTTGTVETTLSLCTTGTIEASLLGSSITGTPFTKAVAVVLIGTAGTVKTIIVVGCVKAVTISIKRTTGTIKTTFTVRTAGTVVVSGKGSAGTITTKTVAGKIALVV